MSDFEEAIVLHRRNYRDTSLIIELFTAASGRVSVVAKGAKRPKSALHHSLQMFQPLLVAWVGKHELMTLTHAELVTPFTKISGQYLAWGFYLNELLYRLIGKHDPYPILFQHYKSLVKKLADNNASESDLRFFEYNLLSRLGYGVQLTSDNANKPIEADSYYHFSPTQSLVKTVVKNSATHLYAGGSILDLIKNNFQSKKSLQDAKRLLRHALNHLLGDKPLKSRDLLI